MYFPTKSSMLCTHPVSIRNTYTSSCTDLSLRSAESSCSSFINELSLLMSHLFLNALYHIASLLPSVLPRLCHQFTTFDSLFELLPFQNLLKDFYFLPSADPACNHRSSFCSLFYSTWLLFLAQDSLFAP